MKEVEIIVLVTNLLIIVLAFSCHSLAPFELIIWYLK